jgi:hypothetical protein
MTTPILPIPASEAERFWSRVDRRNEDECWPWTSTLDSDGYGKLRLTGKQRAAHRVAWALANGRNPDLCVCHSCDNPTCVNPAHLWQGTQADNIRDMHAKGRHRRGRFKKARPQTCKNGHPFIPENRIPNGAGLTTCRICRELQRKSA